MSEIPRSDKEYWDGVAEALRVVPNMKRDSHFWRDALVAMIETVMVAVDHNDGVKDWLECPFTANAWEHPEDQCAHCGEDGKLLHDPSRCWLLWAQEQVEAQERGSDSGKA